MAKNRIILFVGVAIAAYFLLKKNSVTSDDGSFFGGGGSQDFITFPNRIPNIDLKTAALPIVTIGGSGSTIPNPIVSPYPFNQIRSSGGHNLFIGGTPNKPSDVINRLIQIKAPFSPLPTFKISEPKGQWYGYNPTSDFRSGF